MRAEMVIVRHCQSTWNLERRCQGDVVEPVLTPLGQRQARRTGKRLRKFHFDIVYSSDQLRAYETGRIIAAGLGLRETFTDSRLREMFQGEWQGKLYSDIHKDYGDMYGRFIEDPMEVTPPGGETTVQLAQRVADALHDISTRHKKERVLIVSHEFPVALVRCMINGRPLKEAFNFAPSNGEWFHCPWPPVTPAIQVAASQQVHVLRRAVSTGT